MTLCYQLFSALNFRATLAVVVVMIVHHDAKGLTNDAKSNPEDDIAQKRFLEAALEPVCHRDHGDLQEATLVDDKMTLIQ